MIKKRVAVYCRVSTDYDDQINSLRCQKTYFKEYINHNPDWELVEIFADEGISGTSTKKRTEFLRMISMAKAKKIDLIITKEVSRFARNTVDTLIFTRELKALGVGVFFINDNINTLDNDGELRLTIMSSIAQEESRKTSERVKWGQKRRMEQGVVFGNGLFGYTLKNGELNINEKEAEIVRMIFSAFIFEKKGSYTIARELNLAGIKPMHAEEWSSNTVLKILRNEKYCGDLLQRKTCTPDFLSHKRISNVDIEEKLYIENHHESIISKNLFDIAQAELDKRSSKKTDCSRHTTRYWCSGKIFCGECGSRFISISSKSKKGYTYKGWRCFNAKKNGALTLKQSGETIGCDNKSISDNNLLKIVWFIISQYIKDLDFLPEIKKDVELLKFKTYETEINTTNKKLKKLQKKSEAALENFMDGVISKEEYLYLKNKYSQEIESLKNHLISQQEHSLDNNECKNRINPFFSRITQDIYDNVPDQYVLSELIEKITVYKDKTINIEIKYIPYVFTVKYNKIDNDFSVKCTNI